ncbi:hypothetical protein CU098_001350 [Rhizopus stolonifer]|uniref:Regulatory factor Sgt1 n=1 Tax=Rhizopus stolonifer TaxID=4846 RepID=A0A367JSK6_RHIST|nr:hypothetical protein CU098_001350 [Rhizopus stolonifer]
MTELNLQDIFRGSSAKEIDYIQYAIYLPLKESDQATLSYLQDTLDVVYSIIQPIIEDYIWQKDRFQLCIAYDQDQDPSYPFLFGATRFGDCINDEWLIVYLLQKISIEIPEAVISLQDNDGDVILIEAALYLPTWLDPSNSQNRVYLYQGQVRIIPLPKSPADILQLSTGQLMRQKAIDYVRRHANTQASEPIQQSIRDRVDGYPAAAQQEIHRTRCILPPKAAFVLLSEPQLITLAIEAFYLRDPISMKACAAMKTFSPLEGSTETTIKFTRTTYAQTVSQKFYAPKPFRLPSVNEKNKFLSAEMGMKVACGLEMLYYNTQHENEDHTMDTYDFDHDKKYVAYVAHLTQLGYFRDQKKGSQLYQSLEKQAKKQYLIYKAQDTDNSRRIVSLSDLDVDDQDTFKQSQLFGSVRQTIDRLLAEYSPEALHALVASAPDIQDSDDWMNVDPQQLEELLMKRMGNMNEQMMADLQQDVGGEVDLEKMMSSFENFVEKKSGIEGVEFPRENEEDDDDDESDESEYEGDIQFDMNTFMNILKGNSQNEALSQVMEEMDQEVYSHDKISGSFAKLEEEEEDESAPVDVQLNLVKNVLESFKSQQGLPGPVGNMLGQFGFVLPGDNEEEE